MTTAITLLVGALIGGGVQIAVNLIMRELRRRPVIQMLIEDAKRQREVAQEVVEWARRFMASTKSGVSGTADRGLCRVPQHIPRFDMSHWQTALRNPEDLPPTLFGIEFALYSRLQNLNEVICDFTTAQGSYIDIYLRQGPPPFGQQAVTNSLCVLGESIRKRAEEISAHVEEVLRAPAADPPRPV